MSVEILAFVITMLPSKTRQTAGGELECLCVERHCRAGRLLSRNTQAY